MSDVLGSLYNNIDIFRVNILCEIYLDYALFLPSVFLSDVRSVTKNVRETKLCAVGQGQWETVIDMRRRTWLLQAKCLNCAPAIQ